MATPSRPGTSRAAPTPPPALPREASPPNPNPNRSHITGCSARTPDLRGTVARWAGIGRPPRLNVTLGDWPCSWLTRRSGVSHRHLVQRLHLVVPAVLDQQHPDRKSTRLNSSH